MKESTQINYIFKTEMRISYSSYIDYIIFNKIKRKNIQSKVNLDSISMSNNFFQIRLMKVEDLEGVFKLEKQWEDEKVSYIYEPFTKEDFLKTMNKFKDYHLVAEKNNQIVGYVNGIIKNKDNERVFKRGEEYLMIENLYVQSEYRNNNVGGKLIKKILDNAKKNGISKYAVATDTRDMKTILRFYEQQGFKPFLTYLFKID